MCMKASPGFDFLEAMFKFLTHLYMRYETLLSARLSFADSNLDFRTIPGERKQESDRRWISCVKEAKRAARENCPLQPLAEKAALDMIAQVAADAYEEIKKAKKDLVKKEKSSR